MRDIAVFLIVFGSLPFILKRPSVGALMWVWISVMNPHTLGWGFASSFPFAAIIAATTLISLLISKEPKNLPNTGFTWLFIAFVLWMNVTTVFAFQPEASLAMWNRVMKIALMTLVVLMVIKTKQQIQLLIWVVTLSLAFYGVKGGIFTLQSGGQDKVWGPQNTFIGGNNELALALVMAIPLMHYLQMISPKTWVRHALTAAMLLSAIATLGTYSRGALLAIAAMCGFLWLKSRYKASLGVLMVVTIPMLLMFMPEKWGERMDTISQYSEDASVQGRFNAWWMAYNLAKDRPLVGGGFEIYERYLFYLYAPDPNDVHAAHSIYFQALGEHGFVGLGLYLLLWLVTWRSATWIASNTAKREEYKWAFDLARMLQVSLIGFAVGGAFLSLLYFDVPYYLMTAMIATRVLVAKKLKQEAAGRNTSRQPNARAAPVPARAGVPFAPHSRDEMM